MNQIMERLCGMPDLEELELLSYDQVVSILVAASVDHIEREYITGQLCDILERNSIEFLRMVLEYAKSLNTYRTETSDILMYKLHLICTACAKATTESQIEVIKNFVRMYLE